MDTPDKPVGLPLEADATVRELQASYRSLHAQVLALLISLVVINVSVNVFMFKQVSLVHKQEVELNQAVMEYHEKTAPQMNGFVTQLRQFSQTHPDFSRVLAKYIKPTNASPVVLPPSAPASKK